MKKLFALLLAAAMLLALAACGAEQTETAAPAEETGEAEAAETEAEAEPEQTAAAEEGFVPALDTDTEATLYFVGSWGNFEALDQVALDFQQYYPNVEVVYTKLDDYRNDLANRFVTGEEIDLFMLSWWAEEYSLNQNIIDNAEDLNETGIDFSNINADMLQTGQVNGAQTVMPLYLESYGYMVNLDIFEQTGIAVPTTYDELISACEALVEAGYEQPIYMDASHYGRSFVGYYLQQLQSGSDEQTALDSAAALADELIGTGYVTDEGDTLEDTYNAMILRFFEGDIPVMVMPAGQYSGTAKREAKSDAFQENPFEYAFIPAPFEDDGNAYIAQLGSIYMGVYKDSAQLDLANEFLRFMLTDEEMLVLQEIKNMPTANVNNGMQNFPYLAAAEPVYSTADGITAFDEAAALNALSEYAVGGDHTAMNETLADQLENGIG